MIIPPPPHFPLRIYEWQLALAIVALEREANKPIANDAAEIGAQLDYAAAMLRKALSARYGSSYVNHLLEQKEAELADPSVWPSWKPEEEE